MGLFRRFGDILSANLNDLVDRFEDPEKMLRQAIREMEQAVASGLNSAAKVVANERLLANHPGIKALEWIPRVINRRRNDVELAARSDGFDQFVIILP